MKKTLLIAAAALAAGVISSQAQAVYSQNIVGYVNNPLNAGYSVQATPLDNGTGNNLTNLISNPTGNYDGTFVYVWGGNSYNIYQLDSSKSTGVADANDVSAVTSPSLPPGIAWFVNNAAPSNTITYAGTVLVNGPATGSQTVGVTTNVLSSSHQVFIGSVLPIGGGISSVLQLTNPGGVLDGSFIYVPKFTAGGSISGFQISQFDSGKSTGFADANDVSTVAEPVIPVASGFFFSNQSGGVYNWVQGL